MMTASVVVHRDADVLAQAVAARLVTAVVDAQAARGHAHLVLTGGGAGIACLAALRDSPARDAVDWGAVDVWWGDERFLPAGDPERNATQAWDALLSHVPVDPQRVHEMAPSDGEFGEDVDAAAAAYADALAARSRPEDHYPAPTFDVLMLGVGPDGHIASLFPEHPGVHVEDVTALAVRNSPKPPLVRISLSRPTINHALDVWLVAAGDSKAAAVSMALSGADEYAVPAAGAVGRRRTLWLLDAEAAREIPSGLTRIASP